MANFTIEVREMMSNPLIKGVFTFPYDFYGTEEERKAFEKLFIDHYYFYEIGFETPERFKHQLKAKLNLIMPYYRQLAMTEWQKVRNVEEMMSSKNLTETTEHLQEISGNNQTTSDSQTTSSLNQSTSSTNDGKVSNLSDGVSQSSLSDGYLTGVNQSNQTDTGTSSSTSDATQSITGTNGQTLKETTTFTSNGDIGIQTPAYAIEQWRNVIINLNQLIIEECNDLFMKIY